jgi:hypothetical protein
MSKESMKKACDGKCEVAELLREQVEDLQVQYNLGLCAGKEARTLICAGSM